MVSYINARRGAICRRDGFGRAAKAQAVTDADKEMLAERPWDGHWGLLTLFAIGHANADRVNQTHAPGTLFKITSTSKLSPPSVRHMTQITSHLRRPSRTGRFGEKSSNRLIKSKYFLAL